MCIVVLMVVVSGYIFYKSMNKIDKRYGNRYFLINETITYNDSEKSVYCFTKEKNTK